MTAKKYTHLYTVAFQVISDDPTGAPVADCLGALAGRLAYLEARPQEAVEAFGLPEEDQAPPQGALFRQVCLDVIDLLTCNCVQPCDGTCTRGMAERALAQLADAACPTCHGTGVVTPDVDGVCDSCAGTGRRQLEGADPFLEAMGREAAKREVVSDDGVLAPPAGYAEVAWSAEDVQTLRPAMTEAQAVAFLEQNQGHLRDRLIEAGWEAMRDLLSEEAR